MERKVVGEVALSEVEAEQSIEQGSFPDLDGMLPFVLGQKVSRLEKAEPHKRLDDAMPETPLAKLAFVPPGA